MQSLEKLFEKIERIEQSQGKLLAALNEIRDSDIQASLENRLIEQVNLFASLQGRLDAMETVLVDVLKTLQESRECGRELSKWIAERAKPQRDTVAHRAGNPAIESFPCTPQPRKPKRKKK